MSKPGADARADLVETSLPAAVRKHIDLSSLAVEPGSFTGEDLKNQFSDVQMSAQMAGKSAQTMAEVGQRVRTTQKSAGRLGGRVRRDDLAIEWRSGHV